MHQKKKKQNLRHKWKRQLVLKQSAITAICCSVLVLSNLIYFIDKFMIVIMRRKSCALSAMKSVVNHRLKYSQFQRSQSTYLLCLWHLIGRLRTRLNIYILIQHSAGIRFFIFSINFLSKYARVSIDFFLPTHGYSTIF